MVKKIAILFCCFLFLSGVVYAKSLTSDKAILQLVNLTEQYKDWELHKQSASVSNGNEISAFSLKKNLILSLIADEKDKKIIDITFILSADSAISEKKERTKKFVNDELDIIEAALSLVGVSYAQNPTLRKNLLETIGPLNATLANNPETKSMARLDGANATLTAMYTKKGLYILQLAIVP